MVRLTAKVERDAILGLFLYDHLKILFSFSKLSVALSPFTLIDVNL